MLKDVFIFSFLSPFFVTVRPDSGSWPPFMGFRDYTHWTHHTR